MLFLIYITPCFATDYKLDNYYLQTGMGISLPFSAHLFGDLKANQALGFHPPLLQVISIGVPFLNQYNKKYLAALLVGIDFFYAQARK